MNIFKDKINTFIPITDTTAWKQIHVCHRWVCQHEHVLTSWRFPSHTHTQINVTSLVYFRQIHVK